MTDGYCEGCDNPGCRHGGCQGRKPARDVAPGESWAFTEHRTLAEMDKLSDRSKMYASGNRRADNEAPKTPDPRPRSRLYGRMK